MYLLPAIDLLDGQVVRLARGAYDAVTVYHDEPAAQARAFYNEGATHLHVVDLNGARDATPSNSNAIRAIVAATPLRVQVGGGVRSLSTVDEFVRLGVDRVILGTKLATDPAFVKAAVASYGSERLVAGIDARDGQVAIDGWTNATPQPATELVAQLADWGIRHLVYTDIARDGMQSGISLDLYRAVAAAAGFPVIVSGGIATLDDLQAVKEAGGHVAEALIIGRALYEGNFSLSEALSVIDVNSDSRTKPGAI
ncbi:MAG: 1-(5-phosphoribosyl)-5-[(5-phosphoribosylamino)methylideneamino]imidazole-4-carboxamide isomerase [Actinomycetes bacterium]|jgi:phosphoribosylformimino-5-aminoimidazole carboxamide ribotide isomerase|nr:1-(5-phosphoribosyl)-5-[(5-phosphoribosylamino)methylideneamino]imidazole-4-carboxamide isomerase [Actinomycetes bacterium]